MTVSQQLPERGFNSEWITRPLFGIFMAVTAAAILLYSAEWFACLTVILALFAAREWHRMVRSPAQRALAEQRPIHIQTLITIGAIALAVFSLLEGIVLLAVLFLAIGTVASLIFAQQRDDNP
ncbi:MAG TPA: hypothetical protein VHM27_11895, partial [Rhizomicrobium sp.]|nr:hypothetical protein [Rhizomicrobium sp.]